jgi:hypothetical protein
VVELKERLVGQDIKACKTLAQWIRCFMGASRAIVPFLLNGWSSENGEKAV